MYMMTMSVFCTVARCHTFVWGLQISIYDTIDKDANYSSKVRRLGEYHPNLAATKDQEGQDIGDPLYGNEGGVDELVCVSDPALSASLPCSSEQVCPYSVYFSVHLLSKNLSLLCLLVYRCFQQNSVCALYTSLTRCSAKACLASADLLHLKLAPSQAF